MADRTRPGDDLGAPGRRRGARPAPDPWRRRRLRRGIVRCRRVLGAGAMLVMSVRRWGRDRPHCRPGSRRHRTRPEPAAGAGRCRSEPARADGSGGSGGRADRRGPPRPAAEAAAVRGPAPTPTWPSTTRAAFPPGGPDARRLVLGDLRRHRHGRPGHPDHLGHRLRPRRHARGGSAHAGPPGRELDQPAAPPCTSTRRAPRSWVWPPGSGSIRRSGTTTSVTATAGAVSATAVARPVGGPLDDRRRGRGGLRGPGDRLRPVVPGRVADDVLQPTSTSGPRSANRHSTAIPDHGQFVVTATVEWAVTWTSVGSGGRWCASDPATLSGRPCSGWSRSRASNAVPAAPASDGSVAGERPRGMSPRTRHSGASASSRSPDRDAPVRPPGGRRDRPDARARRLGGPHRCEHRRVRSTSTRRRTARRQRSSGTGRRPGSAHHRRPGSRAGRRLGLAGSRLHPARPRRR